MKAFSTNSRFRKAMSSVVSLAMAFSLVVVPTGATAAEPSEATGIVDSGTNLTAFGDVTFASSGLNGDISIDVTGTLPSYSRLQASRASITDTYTLAGLGVKNFTKFRILYGSPGMAAMPTTITGITATMTVAMLRTRIESLVPSVTASIVGSPTRLWLTAEDIGKASIAVTDTVGGVGKVVFGSGLTTVTPDAFGDPLGKFTNGRVFEGGSDYTGNYFGGGVPLTAAVSFSSSDYVDYVAGNATLGTLDGTGAFVPALNGAGLYTAIKLPTGYDAVLSSVGGLGIGAGNVTCSLQSGTRDLMKPELRISSAPGPAEAGGVATITAEFRGLPSSGYEGGIDSATLILPDGFVPTQDGAMAMVGSSEASIVVDAGARTATIDNFFATDTDRLVVTLASEMPTTPGEYAATGTFRNIAGSAVDTVTSVSRIKVVPFGITITASPAILGSPECGYAMAGGIDMVTFTARGNFPKAGVAIIATPTASGYAGALDNTRAVTNESGIATFTVRADSPSTSGDLVRYGRSFKQFKFVDEDDDTVGAFGYAHFYASEISGAAVDKMVAFADGTDTITYTFTARNPSTKAPVPAGTRIYFAPGGWDAAHTALSDYSGVVDENGQASVEVSRDDAMTAYDQQVWVVASTDSSFTVGASRPAGTPGVQFMDYIASSDETVTAQQSSRGASVTAEFVIRDSAGNAVEFTRLDGMMEATSTDVLKAAPLTASIKGSAIHVGAEVMADDSVTGWAPKAGDIVQAALNGQVTALGPFDSQSAYVFGIDMPIHIVNNATVRGIGSVYLGKANITGTGLRGGTPSIRAVQGDRTFSLSLATIAVDLDGEARPQMFDMPVTMVKGTYDLVIDGITFPDALEVGDGIAIGVAKVVIQLGVNRGLYPNYATPGSSLTLFGAVSTVGNASVPSAIVHVYSSASSTGANPTFIGSVLTANGQFSYKVTADKTKYYFATTNPNMQYMAGDSRDAFGEALMVGVKSRASMKITSLPRSAVRNRNFTLKGTVPSHSHDTTVVVRAYLLVGRRWVNKSSFTTSIPAGTASFTRSMKLTTKGSWRVIITHVDWDHLASSSPYKGIVIK